ncbi:MAG TPA: hypothetical protein PLD84_16190, partial [Chitinophagales bacterium]|nr:hypothetical protein [Chitinophagales bacterium]
MKQSSSLQRLTYLVGLFIFFLQITAIAQPAVSTLRHETQSQQQCVVTFAAALSGTSAAAQWTMRIGGVAVGPAGTGITGVVVAPATGRVTITFNLNGLAGHGGAEPYVKPGEVLSFDFSNAGNTLKNAAGTLNATAFVNQQSLNNWPGDCSDLGFFQQGNIPLATVRFCSPVVMDFYQYQYYLSLRIRNSTVWPGGNLLNQVTWGDGTALQNFAGYQSDPTGNPSATVIAPAALAGNPAVIITSRPTHNYPPTLPGTGGDCSWNATVTPALNFTAGLPCAGALSVQTTFATWDTDNKNTGTLNLPPLVAGSNLICLGTNANMKFTDNTTLNCRAAIEPLTPNTQQRWIKIVYGSTNYGAPGNIPDIRVTLPAVLGGGT